VTRLRVLLLATVLAGLATTVAVERQLGDLARAVAGLETRVCGRVAP
jgi:hypothetical protein